MKLHWQEVFKIDVLMNPIYQTSNDLIL
jgi:hypothetical protein